MNSEDSFQNLWQCKVYHDDSHEAFDLAWVQGNLELSAGICLMQALQV